MTNLLEIAACGFTAGAAVFYATHARHRLPDIVAEFLKAWREAKAEHRMAFMALMSALAGVMVHTSPVFLYTYETWERALHLYTELGVTA